MGYFYMVHKFTRLAALCLSFSLLLAPAAGLAASGPRDADSNAMVYNGAYSRAELTQKLKNGDGVHSASSLQKEFSSRGVTIAEIQSDNMVNGQVTKGGRVIVDGKTVATNARSWGRQNMAGSKKDGNLYVRPTEVSFQSSSLDAFVYMKDGVFQYAIIKACGNLVEAKAVAKQQKAEVKQPAPKVIVVQQQQQQVVTAPAPAPTPAATTLPKTGPEAGLAALAGTTLMGLTSWRYRRSRQSLADSLLRRN